MAFIGNNPTAVPLTGSQIADGTIVNANVATNTLNLTQKVTSTLPVANGGTGAASATAYAVQCGGTTSTGAYQSIASVGTSGQVLTSNGAGALPTFQTTGAAAGQVIQVVSATRTTQTSYTSTSYVTMNLSASITPASTSNKIIIMVNGYAFCAGYGNRSYFTLYRGSTNLLTADGFKNIDDNLTQEFSYQYLDSPSTTSSTTYALYGKTPQLIQFPQNGVTGTIILMEVKG